MPKDKWRKERKRVPSRVPRETQDDSEFKGLLEKSRKIVLRGTPKRRGGSRG
jgi:hypothetical protein